MSGNILLFNLIICNEKYYLLVHKLITIKLSEEKMLCDYLISRYSVISQQNSP